MNDTEQRIAIAKHLGLLWYHEDERMWAVKRSGCFTSAEHACWRLPNYPADLNAMHEACESVPDFEWCKFWERLETVTETRVFCKDITDDCKGMLGATAAQRAEAFLKTLNLWKP